MLGKSHITRTIGTTCAREARRLGGALISRLLVALNEIGAIAAKFDIKTVDDLEFLLDDQAFELAMSPDAIALMPQPVRAALLRRLKAINHDVAQEIQYTNTQALLVASDTARLRESIAAVQREDDKAALIDALATRLSTLEMSGSSRKKLADESALPFADHTEDFFKWKKEELGDSAITTYRKSFSRFTEIVSDKPLRDIDQNDVVAFLDALMSSDGAKHGKERLSRDTLNKYLSNIKSFFGWAEQKNRVHENPAIKVHPPRDSKNAPPPRLAFSREQLTTIFNAPLFTGCQSENRVHAPGKFLCRDARFWLPITALLTGARLGELEQMQVKNVEKRGPNGEYWVLSVVSEDPKVVDGDESTKKKTVKTLNAIRILPVHPFLRKLGFLQYVEAMKVNGPESLLFPASRYGRLFNEVFLEKVGITGSQYSFHSLRHSYKTYIRASNLNTEIQNRLMGHSPGTIGERYGRELDNKELKLYHDFTMENPTDPIDLVHLMDFSRRMG
jgi:integrase